MNNKQRMSIGVLLGVLCSGTILAVGFVLYYTPNLEDDDEMKYEQFSAISGTADGYLEDNQNVRNIHKYGSKIYFCRLSLAPVQITMTSYPTAFSGESKTDEDTVSGNTAANSVHDVVTRGWDNDIYWAIMDTDDVVSTYIATIRYGSSTDGGSTWTDSTYATAPVDNTNGNMRMIDIFKSGVDIYAIYSYEDKTGTTKYVGITKNWASDIVITDNPTDIDAVYAGKVNADGDYVFVLYDGSNFKKVTYDCSAGTDSSVTISGPSTPASWNVNVQQYWFVGSIERLSDEDQYILSTDSWSSSTSFTESGTNTNGCIWDQVDDVYQINYDIYKDAIFKLSEKGYPTKIQTFTDDAYVGWSIWIVNGADTIYQMNLTTLPLVAKYRNQCFIEQKSIYKSLNGQLITTSAPFANQVLWLYDNFEELSGIFNVKSGGQVGTYFHKWILTDISQKDREKEINLDNSDDSPQMLADALDECIFLYDGGNIDTTPATARNINWRGAKIDQIRNVADLLETYVSPTYPDGEVRYTTWDTLAWDYKVRHNCVDWGTAASPDLTAWTDSSGADCTVSIVAEVDGHKNVLQLDDQNAAGNALIELSFTGQTTGIIELKFRSTDTGQRTYIARLYENSTVRGIIYIENDNLYYYDGSTHDIGDVADNTWYILRVEFSCTSDDMDIYLDNTLAQDAAGFNTAATVINKLQMTTFDGDSGYQSYFDSIGFSWDGYTASANQQMLDPRQGVTRMSKLNTNTLQTPFLQLYGKGTAATTVQGNPNPQPLTVRFPNLEQTELDALGTALETARNQTYQFIKLKYAGHSRAIPGTSIEVDYPPESLTGTWYILSVKYMLVSQNNIVGLSSGKFVPIRQRPRDVIENSVTQVDRKTSWTWRDPATYDFDETSLTDDTSWHDLDLSTIVGSGKKLVVLRVKWRDNAVSSSIRIRRNGDSNLSEQYFWTTVASGYYEQSPLFETDENGKLEIRCSPKPTDWSDIDIVVRGYRDA